jgi:hypothetical protein
MPNPSETRGQRAVRFRRERFEVVALRLDQYLQARAEKEGHAYALSPDFFLKYLLGTPTRRFFGITVSTKSLDLEHDDQEPEPGFLAQWKSKRAN